MSAKTVIANEVKQSQDQRLPRRSDELLAMTRIRVGKIAYTNTLPFYLGLTESDGVREGYPAQINEWIKTGQIDLSPISSLEYAARPGEYYLLPGICIASNHFSGSVLLFSKFAIKELNGKKIAISAETYSSQALLKILLTKYYGFKNTYVTSDSRPEEMFEKADACLAIGDSALFHSPKEFCFKYDLAYLWQVWTEKPFCFSVWAVKRSFFDQNPDEVWSFHEKLRQNTKQNLQDIKSLVLHGTKLPPYDERFTVIFSYLSQLVYDLNESVQEGLLEFFKFSADLGLTPRLSKLEFIPEKV